jgi:hypothetical protein
MLLPESMRGKHVKCDTLLNDEGGTMSVREYLNTASGRVMPKGICDIVYRVLQSKVTTNAMRLDCILEHRLKAEIARGISLCTGHPWLHKLGWIWSRERKRYVDGQERSHVVEHRKKVFLPACLALRSS